ncbi:MAG TPA: hypothetical protein IAC01_02595 [Candidatus Limicola stercorigallinarum]|nr:hypothetical protein [Candidatus Limicola stercorigallinarum]
MRSKPTIEELRGMYSTYLDACEENERAKKAYAADRNDRGKALDFDAAATRMLDARHDFVAAAGGVLAIGRDEFTKLWFSRDVSDLMERLESAA